MDQFQVQVINSTKFERLHITVPGRKLLFVNLFHLEYEATQMSDKMKENGGKIML
jgi:hypothetical protein